MQYPPFTCYIIGDDYLAAKCGKQIIQNGGIIAGILSADARVIEWAANNEVPFFNSFADFEQAIIDSKFDYLFSISNKKILSGSIINAPQKMAINYHNAPLPKYAGTYATLWSILNKEKSHGVTWHVMTDNVDAGDILEQIEFPITTDDTMVTLNTRCHEYAIKLFEELIRKIVIGAIELRKQKGEIEYYPLSKRLKYDGFILWSNSANEINRLYRALNSYPYINHIGLPKLLIGDMVFIPRLLKISTKESQNKPGVITNLSKNFIEIATANQNIVITKLLDLGGKEYPIANLINKFNIKIKECLPIPSKRFLYLLEKYNHKYFNYESYWVKKLSSIQPLELPYVATFKYDSLSSNKVISCTYSLADILRYPLIKKICANTKIDDFIYTLLIIYIYRINNYEPFTIGYTDSRIKKISKYSKYIYANVVPLSINFAIEAKRISSIFAILQHEISSLKKNVTYKRDVFLRYPMLSDKQPTFNLIINAGSCSATNLDPQGSLVINFQEENCHLRFTSKNFSAPDDFKKITRLMVSHIKTWLKSITEKPNIPVVNLPMLTKTEHRQLLTRYRGEKINYSSDKLDKFVAKHAIANPKRTALILDNETLSYGDLDAKSSYLATYLHQQNIKAGNIVGISLEDNISFIIAILAIMKINAVYLPLDPSYPDTNLNFMLNNSKANLLIASPNLKSRLTSQFGNILFLDRDFFSTTPRLDNHNNKKTKNNISHIIYTSGSTGNPKGIMVSRKNISNSLAARIHYYDQATKIKHEDISFLLLLSTSFDTAVAAIFWPLMCGAKLVLLSPYSIKDVNQVIETIKQNNITHIMCVSSLYQIILEKADISDLNSLRVVIIGGDQCEELLAKTHVSKASNAYLFNEYGVTEATIWSTVQKVYDAKTKEVNIINIGRPVPNNNIYLFDKYMQLVPQGVVGELFLGGDSITAGYVNRDELTKERFINYKDFTGQRQRLYKTGDLCRYYKQGLEFLGRIDNQVKIRGFRIELPQIEKIISQYENIKQCVVADKIVNANKQLVAYILKHDPNIQLNQNTMVDYLATRLPSYMIPSFFITIRELPLTSNNKIDRNKLPIPDRKYIANNLSPQYKNDTEKRLGELWQEILKLDNIAVNDSFFVLGGHSLLISELLIRIKKQFKAEIKIQDFLEQPTIENLAAIIDSANFCTSVKTNYTIDFSKEVILDQAIQPSCVSGLAEAEPKAILLTGATGFLGTFLLKMLYQHTKAEIYCLTRAENNDQARSRLHNCMNNNGLNSSIVNNSRVKTIAADLSLPFLGLSRDFFNLLSEKIDTIYHNGAYVHHLYNYELLKPSNVGSTLEIIKLGCLGKPKKIHYISTLSAATEVNNNKIKETFHQALTSQTLSAVGNGYVQTKIVSESLLKQAVERGVRVNIYRPTWILWPTNRYRNVPIPNNHLLHLILGCMQMGYAPDWELILNIWPVDVLSDYLIRMSLININESKIFNFQNVNIISWKDLIRWLDANCTKIKLIPHEQWLAHHVSTVNQDSALFPILSFYLNGHTMVDNLSNMMPDDVEDTNVKDSFNELGLEYPEIYDSLLNYQFNFGKKKM